MLDGSCLCGGVAFVFECQRLTWIPQAHGLPWYERAAPPQDKVVQALF
jgi:hypothetical protein